MFVANRVSVTALIASLPLIAASAPGIKNFDRVDANVYRGGQPDEQGFQYLAKLGVKTIVDLREAGERSKVEQREVTGLGMTYVNVPMTGLTAPSDAQITKILAILEDGSTGPAFVHCRRGADRTGAVLAAYHIDHDHWNNNRALKDAKAHKMSFFQFPREDFIRNFQASSVDARLDAAKATPTAVTSAAATTLAAPGVNGSLRVAAP